MVTRAVLLDSGPLGLASNRNGSPATAECNRWLRGLIAAGVRVIVPEIADYEVRRELLRAGKAAGLGRLAALAAGLEYLPITTAASLWDAARQGGRSTAAPEALDGDAILAAQALTLGERAAVVATTNVGHLSRFVAAAIWRDLV